MQASETIVALGSAPGFSARAIVRAGGAGAWSLLEELTGVALGRSRGLHAVRIGLTDEGLSVPAMVMCFVAPDSYTGEDAFELVFPGNPMLVDRVMQRMLTRRSPARLATPGEFSARAYLNGKMELEQAEGVAAIIAARSAEQLGAARRLLDGVQGREYRAWSEELLTLLALVEAGIDFTDQEDVVAIDAVSLDARLGAIERAMVAMSGRAAPSREGSALPVAALVGPPSAGKSTLFNRLLGERRAVTSEEGGTTRDVLRERMDLARDVPGGGAVELLDLPGLDDPAREGVGGPSAAAAQEAAARALAGADMLIYCDPTGRFGAIAGTRDGVGIIRVRTKADLLENAKVRAERTGEEGGDVLAVCALDGWHIGPLRRAIADAAVRGAMGGEDSILIPRHRRALLAAVESVGAARLVLAGARERPHRMADPALLAESLRRAAESLGDLTGKVAPDDVLGRIFATFCIGK